MSHVTLHTTTVEALIEVLGDMPTCFDVYPLRQDLQQALRKVKEACALASVAPEASVKKSATKKNAAKKDGKDDVALQRRRERDRERRAALKAEKANQQAAKV